MECLPQKIQCHLASTVSPLPCRTRQRPTEQVRRCLSQLPAGLEEEAVVEVTELHAISGLRFLAMLLAHLHRPVWSVGACTIAVEHCDQRKEYPRAHRVVSWHVRVCAFLLCSLVVFALLLPVTCGELVGSVMSVSTCGHCGDQRSPFRAAVTLKFPRVWGRPSAG